MGEISDCYKVTMVQSLNGEEVLNIFHYLQTAASVDAGDLATAFEAYFPQALDDRVSTALQIVEIRAENLADPINDYAVVTSTEAGSVTGDYNPPYVAWSYRLNRFNRSTRNGYKRFAGVPEALVSAGVTNPASLALMQGLEPALIYELEVAATPSFLPVIARVTGSLGSGYTVFTNPIASATFLGLTHQTSRKD